MVELVDTPKGQAIEESRDWHVRELYSFFEAIDNAEVEEQ